MIDLMTTPGWVVAFLALYFLVSFTLFLYGIHAYLMAFLFWRVRDKKVKLESLRTFPHVTVQLPIFNERYVAGRLIDAVAAMNYPSDKLEIQVLDDSTDDTQVHIDQVAARWREKGIDVSVLRREHRVGYKAGALAAGLKQAKGEFVAVFDADFLPDPEFLMRTIPGFANPRVGMVQTRWGHLNEGYSPLTRAQAMALDGHFVVEQTVRNRYGAFMNFNGTAGVWRKRCIEEAGGWQHDTLTEDLDLSYRAQLAGWNFLFLPEVVSPAELPAEVNGLKGQQFRWAKGSVQTAVKLLPRMFRAKLSLFERFQSLVHLTNHAVYPLLLLLGLLALPALLILDHYPGVEKSFTVATVLVVASFGHPWMYFLTFRHLNRTKAEALATIPAVLAGGMGIAINNTRAFVEGLSGHQTPFIRTPKYALRKRSDSWQGKKYQVPFSPWTIAEILLGLYALAALVYAALNAHYLVIPFLLMYVTGGLYVGGVSLAQSIRPHAPVSVKTALSSGE